MFYLNQFFKVLWRSRAYTLVLLALSLFLCYLSLAPSNVFELWNNKAKKEAPYFNALVSKRISLIGIQRKLEALNGIQKVESKEDIDPGEQLKAIGHSLKSSILTKLASKRYSTLKVTFINGVSLSSEKLVKEYLKRLIGEDALTISTTVYPQVKKNLEVEANFILSNGHYFAIGLLAVFWILVFNLLSHSNCAYFNLLEKFQRRNQVSFKTMLSGSFFCMMLGTLFSYQFLPELRWRFFFLILAVLILGNLINLKAKRKGIY